MSEADDSLKRAGKPRPIRVLQVYRTYFPDPQGGLQEAIRQACLATQPFGIRHRIFTLSPAAQPRIIRRPEGVVYRADQHLEITSSGFSLSAVAPFRALVQWADVVHYHFPWPFADLLDLLARVDKPRVVTYHSDIVRQQFWLQLYRPLMRHFLNQADRLIATSPAYAESSRVLQDYREKLEIIPLGLDERAFPEPSTEEIHATREQYGQDYFLFIGVLRYYKGLDTLLEAVQESQLQVVIVGDGPEGQRLRALARVRGLGNVQFAGIISDQQKVALIRGCRAIVFPSNARSEAFGITLVEGAMLGRPLICTELGTGTTFINKHNETGLVVAPDDASSLRQAMEQLHADPALAEQFGRNSRQRFERLFSAQPLGRKLSALYRQL
ncbi:MAG: glycosyltransferase [Lamprobacter sp.]|uniref:glycosyltransferase n=1 Tax=Lamprobacter sp. TaxID=3100796 RepID=UPI002B26075A|nr:glycosyltransferase [Lamprobacter sp.]MEA3640806.1 glycosyltransferase [Lamprobacter sp.]